MGGHEDRTAAEQERARELGLADEESPIEFLSSVLTAIPAFITRTDQNLIIRYINQVIPEIERSEVIGKSVFDFVAPQDHEVARTCFEGVKASGNPGRYEAQAGEAGSPQSYYVNHVTAIRDPDGTTGLCIVGMDVTAERERAEALRRSEEMLRVAIESTGIGMWTWNFKSSEVTWNDRMREIFGVEEALSFEDFLGDFVHPDDQEAVANGLKSTMTTGDLKSPPHRIIRSDGEVRWVLSIGKIFDLGTDSARMLGGIIDISDQRSMEELLRQAQKMEAVGNLTAGVAHNFNNMLMVLLPTIDMVKPVVPASHLDLLENASHAGQRATEMVRQLMTFSGLSPSSEREPHRASRLVDKAVLMAQGLLDRAIEISSQSTTDSAAKCNSGEIEQVLLNIILNARDALSEAKTANPSISLKTDLARPESVSEKGSPETGYLRISITDNGPGMSKEVLRQIFEPFFTTKLPQGTGLGLAMSYAMIRDHGGWIQCRSEIGSGTTFHIYLPISKERAITEEPEAEEPSTERPRVLVVDDEPAIRKIARRILEVHEYPVVTAGSVAQAQELLQKDPNFQVVLLDRSMPGVRGNELLPRIRKELPSARVYYFTGEPVAPESAQEVDGIVQKPLTADGLIQALQRK